MEGLDICAAALPLRVARGTFRSFGPRNEAPSAPDSLMAISMKLPSQCRPADISTRTHRKERKKPREGNDYKFFLSPTDMALQ